nr:hypothetical protein [Tanacetum cinerariifolium]
MRLPWLDTVQLETAVSTISQEYLLEFTSEYGISKALHLELPDWRTSAPKDEMLVESTYSSEAVMVLNTRRTPIQKQPEALLCLVGLSRRYLLRDEVYHTFLHDDGQDMDLFNLIRASNPTKVKTGTHPCAAHEVPLLIVTVSRVIEMEDPAAEAVALKVPPPENVTTTGVAPEAGQAEGIAATGPHVIKERRKRGNDEIDTNAPPKVPRRDHADSRLTQSTHGGKSLGDMGSSKGASAAGDSELENTSFTSMVGSPESIYRPEWGVTNGSLLDALKACQDLVDHIAPPGYFSEMRHLHNDGFLKQYNVNLARQVAMGSQLRLRFEQEAKPLKKSVAQVAHWDKRIQARENEIKNLETLPEAETDIKKTTEGKSAKLSKELENLQALFSDLQVSNDRLSQQVSTLQAQVTGEEKLKAAFGEFKQYEDNRVEKRCAEWTRMGDWTQVTLGSYEVRAREANLSLEAIEAYDPEAEAKYIAALHDLKDLKYPIVDQLESLKDASMDVIMASLHLESDIGADAPLWIRELRPSSSQLKIPVYPEVRDPTDHRACKEEILLADAIAANVSHAEKKKKC